MDSIYYINKINICKIRYNLLNFSEIHISNLLEKEKGKRIMNSPSYFPQLTIMDCMYFPPTPPPIFSYLLRHICPRKHHRPPFSLV